MNRFRNHCLLRAGSLRLVITYFDPLGVGLLLVFLTVLFLILGSKGGGDFAVEGGKFGFEGFKSVFVRTALVDCAKPHRPAFELGYECLLAMQEVELVRVQRLLNRIDDYIHLIISIQLGNLVAGSYGSAIPLSQVRGTPRRVQMMDANRSLLGIYTCSSILVEPNKTRTSPLFIASMTAFRLRSLLLS